MLKSSLIVFLVVGGGWYPYGVPRLEVVEQWTGKDAELSCRKAAEARHFSHHAAACVPIEVKRLIRKNRTR